MAGQNEAAGSSAIDDSPSSPPTTANPVTDAHFQKLLQQERIIQAATVPAEQMPTCFQQFDKMANCFALFPQLRNVYRFGNFNDCSGKVNDWKFCLTLRGMKPEQKREAYIERRSRMMAKRRMPGGDTSEEIWDIRDNPIIDPQFVEPAFLPKPPSQPSQAQTG